MVICVTEINSIDQFLELRDVWNGLLNKCKDKNVYLTWEYLSIFLEHFGKRKKLRILLAQNDSNIIAIAPLRQSRYKLLGPLSYDVIEPLAYQGADYTGFMLAEREMECFKLFLDHFLEYGDWDFMYLYDFPETSVITELMPKASSAIPFASEFVEGAECPYITLPDSTDTLMNGLDRKFRKDMRRCMKNLQRDYGKVELKGYDGFGSVEEAMTAYFELHQRRWKAKHMPGVFGRQAARDFHMDVAKHFAENGWLALYFLMVNDEPIATSYNYVYDQRMYFVLGGFDPNFSTYGVGNLVLAKVIEKCIEKGIKEYDLMKGSEVYKSKWTKTYRKNFGIRITNRKLTSSLYDWGIKAIKRTKVDEVLTRAHYFVYD